MARVQQLAQPSWLNSAGQEPLPKPKPKWTTRRTPFFDNMLADINHAISEDFSTAHFPVRSRGLQRLHVNTKIAAFVILLLIAASTREISWLIALHTGIGMAAFFSGITLREYVARTWLPAITFAGIAVFPSIFSGITPGEAWYILSIGKWSIVVTRQGVTGAFFVFLRATVSLGLIMLLIKTTRWPIITAALREIGFPAVVVAILDLTYRYLFLFLLLLAEYVLGRKSRVVGKTLSHNNISWIGSSLAGFFRLTDQYSSDITLALVSRGYNGAFATAVPYVHPYCGGDKLAAAVLMAIAAVFVGRIVL